VRQPSNRVSWPGNFNIGRPQSESLPHAESELQNDRPAFSEFDPRSGRKTTDSHAVGTAGGGTAVGGLAGSTVGAGDPSPDLDAAMASSRFDATLDSENLNLQTFADKSSRAPARKRAQAIKARASKKTKLSNNSKQR